MTKSDLRIRNQTNAFIIKAFDEYQLCDVENSCECLHAHAAFILAGILTVFFRCACEGMCAALEFSLIWLLTVNTILSGA